VTVVLDASALLAYLLQEPGAEVVRKALSAGVDVEGMRDDLQALGMQVEPFLAVDGERAGQLWLHTRQQGLTVVTCDRAWARLPLELEVQVVRCDPAGPAG
jgi:PIN domain nuclease of toxin-antitoxin system